MHHWLRGWTPLSTVTRLNERSLEQFEIIKHVNMRNAMKTLGNVLHRGNHFGSNWQDQIGDIHVHTYVFTGRFVLVLGVLVLRVLFGCFLSGSFCSGWFLSGPLLSEYIHYNRKLNITFNFRFHMYEKCFKSVTSHLLPLSQTVTPPRTPPPSSMTYFMDGPFCSDCKFPLPPQFPP